MADFDALGDRSLRECDGDLVGMRFGDVRTHLLVPVGIVLGGQPEQQAVWRQVGLDQIDAVAVARAVEQPSPDGEARRLGVDRAEQDGVVVWARIVGLELAGVFATKRHFGAVDVFGNLTPRRRRTPGEGEGRGCGRGQEEGSAAHG